MNTQKKISFTILFAIMFSVLIMPMFSIVANAEPNVMPINETAPQPRNGVAPINNKVTDREISGDSQLPNVSFNEAKDLVESKTYDVVNLLQIFAKPFSALVFIGCAVISLFGALTRSSYVGKGLLGMFISGMMYTAVLYAPEIMNFFSGWLAN